MLLFENVNSRVLLLLFTLTFKVEEKNALRSCFFNLSLKNMFFFYRKMNTKK